MIIACPECSQPFEIPADHVAALVQVACPHCQFRMILDFEAANDPSLVEEGMQMASGWHSAADYRSALSGAARPQLVAEAAPEPEPEPEEIEVTPDPELEVTRIPPSSPARTPAARQPVVAAPEPEPEPEVAPAAAEAAPPARTGIRIQLDESMDYDEAPTRIHTPPQPAVERMHPSAIVSRPIEPEPEPAPEPAAPLPRPAAAQIQPEPEPEPAPMPPITPAPFDDRPTSIAAPDARTVPLSPPAERSQTVAASRPTANRVPPSEPAPVARTVAPVPTPVPASDDTAARPDTSGERPRPKPRFETFDEPLGDEDRPKSSAFATVMVALLLLLALGLVGASLALEQTPDPRPLLEKLYRQYLG